jgi:hypothetical protein
VTTTTIYNTTLNSTTANITTLNAGSINVSGVTVKNCTTPAPFDSTGVVPAAKMLRGVVKCSATVAVAMTLPAASAIAALIPSCGQGTQFDWVVDNSASTATGTVTVTLPGSITVGTGVVTGGNTLTLAPATIGKFAFYFITTSAGYIYRIF